MRREIWRLNAYLGDTAHWPVYLLQTVIINVLPRYGQRLDTCEWSMSIEPDIRMRDAPVLRIATNVYNAPMARWPRHVWTSIFTYATVFILFPLLCLLAYAWVKGWIP